MGKLYGLAIVLVLTVGTWISISIIEKIRFSFDWGFIPFLLATTGILAIGTFTIANEDIGLLFILLIVTTYLAVLREFEYLSNHRSDSFGKHFKSGLISFAIMGFFLIYWVYFFMPGGDKFFQILKETSMFAY